MRIIICFSKLYRSNFYLKKKLFFKINFNTKKLKMKYDLQKRIFLNGKFLITNSIALVQRAYRRKYKSKTVPSWCTILGIVDNYKKTGPVDRKRIIARKKTARTEELIKSVENLYLADNRISLRKMANLVPASISTIRNVAQKDLYCKPNKVPR